MSLRIRLFQLSLAIVAIAPVSVSFAQERDGEADKRFKLELFRQAVGIKQKADYRDLLAEAAIALGVASQPEFSHLVARLPDGVTENYHEQLRAVRGATAAASYAQAEYAQQVFDRMEPTIEKLELAVHLAFAQGFKSKKPEMLNVLAKLDALKGKRLTWIGGDLEEDDVREISEQKLSTLRAELFCAYHCGRASSGQQLDPEFETEIGQPLFRDLVRIHRIRFLQKEGLVRDALAETRGLESVQLRHGITYQIAQALIGTNSEPTEREAVSKALFESLLATAKDDAKADQSFSLDSCFEELERLDCEEPTGDLLTDSLPDSVELIGVLQVSIDLGFCLDGSDVAALIENKRLRREWLKAVLRLKEHKGELEAAWQTSRQLRDKFNFELGSADAYADSLARAAVRARRFEIAETLVSAIEDAEVADAARDYLSIHRGNDADLVRARALAPKLFADFDRELAAVESEKQLQWLLTASVKFRRKLDVDPLYGRIKREIEARRESKSRARVVKEARKFLNSFTKPDKVSLRLLGEFVRILDVDVMPSDGPMAGIEAILQRIDKQPNMTPDQFARYNKLLRRFCTKLDKEQDRDSVFADIALLMAKRGNQASVTEMNGLIRAPSAKIKSLIDCAIAYPPTTKPIRGEPLFERPFGVGGFGNGAGFF